MFSIELEGSVEVDHGVGGFIELEVDRSEGLGVVGAFGIENSQRLEKREGDIVFSLADVGIARIPQVFDLLFCPSESFAPIDFTHERGLPLQELSDSAYDEA